MGNSCLVWLETMLMLHELTKPVTLQAVKPKQRAERCSLDLQAVTYQENVGCILCLMTLPGLFSGEDSSIVAIPLLERSHLGVIVLSTLTFTALRRFFLNSLQPRI